MVNSSHLSRLRREAMRWSGLLCLLGMLVVVPAQEEAGTLSFPDNDLHIPEGDVGDTSLVLTVARQSGSAGRVTVQVTSFQSSNATEGVDYAPVSQVLTWEDGDATSKAFTVQIHGDAEVEGEEWFGLQMTAPGGGAVLATSAMYVAIANDDQSPGGSFSILSTSSNAYSPAAGTAHVVVVRQGSAQGAASVAFQTMDYYAIAGRDYTAVVGTLTWEDGDASARTIQVPLLADAPPGAGGQFYVYLSDPSSGTSINNGYAWIQILPVLPPARQQIRFQTNSWQVTERNAGTTELGLMVERQGSGAGELRMHYTTGNGTATAGTDFIQDGDTLVWADGDMAPKDIRIRIVGDAEVESDEYFYVYFADIPSGVGVSDASCRIIIVNDDTAAAPATIAFTRPNWTMPVGTTDTEALFTVSRAGDEHGRVGVTCTAIPGSAGAESFTLLEPTSLVWEDGDTQAKALHVRIRGQAPPVEHKDFRLHLQDATGGAVIGTPGEAVISLASTYVPPVIIPTGAWDQIGFVNTYEWVHAGDALTLKVNRQGSCRGEVTVSYASKQYQQSEDLIVPLMGTLTWADGESGERTILLSTRQNGAFGADPYCWVRLFSVTGRATLVKDRTYSSVQIQDDQIGVISVGNMWMTDTEEGGAGETKRIQVPVSRQGSLQGEVSIHYRVDVGNQSPATPGVDFDLATGILTWPDGDGSTRMIPVDIHGNDVEQANRTIDVSLWGVGGSARVSTNTWMTRTLTIIDDDQAPDSTVGFMTFDAPERVLAGKTATVPVQRLHGAGAVTVQYVVGTRSDWWASEAARPGVDFTPVGGELHWDAGDLEPKMILVPTVAHAGVDPQRFVHIKLQGSSDNLESSHTDANVLILDDETSHTARVRFSDWSYTVQEGGPGQHVLTVPVQCLGATAGAVTVQCTFFDGSAQAGRDYIGGNQLITWADGDRSPRWLDIPILGNADAQSDRDFRIEFTAVVGPATLATPMGVTITIADDDDADGDVIAFAQWRAMMSEGDGPQEKTITLERLGTGHGAASVRWGADLYLSQAQRQTQVGEVAWLDGDCTPKTFVLHVDGDTVAQGDGYGWIHLSRLSGDVEIPDAYAQLSIFDDDGPDEMAHIIATPSLITVRPQDGDTFPILLARAGDRRGTLRVKAQVLATTGVDGGILKQVLTMSPETVTWPEDDDAPRAVTGTVDWAALAGRDATVTVFLTVDEGRAQIDTPQVMIKLLSAPVQQDGIRFTRTRYEYLPEAVVGGNAMVTLARVGSLTEQVTVQWEASAYGNSLEYSTTVTGTAQWAAGDGADKSVAVALPDFLADPFADEMNDGDRRVRVLVRSITGASMLGGDTADIVIARAIKPRIAFVSPWGQAEVVNVGSSTRVVQVTVGRFGSVQGRITVRCQTVAQGYGTVASPGVDYQELDQTLVWEDEDRSPRTVSVTILGNDVPQPDRYVFLSLMQTGGVKAIMGYRHTILLRDDDGSAPKSAGFIRSTQPTWSFPEGDAGQRTVWVALERVGGSNGSLSVPYFLSPGQGGNSILPAHGTMTWMDGEMGTKRVPVAIIGDGVREYGADRATLNLDQPTSSIEDQQIQVQIEVVDDDGEKAAVLQGMRARFASASLLVQEGTDHTVTIPVLRADDGHGLLRMRYETRMAEGAQDQMRALPTVDYVASEGVLIWADGDLSPRQIVVTLVNDQETEDDESFFVTMSDENASRQYYGYSSGIGGVATQVGVEMSPTQGDFGGWAYGVDTSLRIIIRDDDVPVAGRLQFHQPSWVQEDDQGKERTVTVSIDRVGGARGVVAVGINIWPASVWGAAGESPYSPRSGVLTWADGDTAPKTWTVTVRGPALPGQDRVIVCSLANACGGAVLADNGQRADIILKAPVPRGGTISFTSSVITVDPAAEDQVADTIVEVQRREGATGAVTVQYALIPDRAGVLEDANAGTGLLEWADGDDAPKAIHVRTRRQSGALGDARVRISLSVLSGQAVIAKPTETLLLVQAAVPTTGAVHLVGTTWTTAEGDEAQRSCAITVERVGPALGAASVGYQVYSLTDPLPDMNGANVVVWQAGESGTRTITLTWDGDQVVEPDVLFQVILQNPVGTVIAGGGAGVLTVADDDANQHPPEPVVEEDNSGGGCGFGGGITGILLVFLFGMRGALTARLRRG